MSEYNIPDSGMISAGTLVRVCTTNGGEVVGRLERTYVPSYAVDLDVCDRTIMAARVESVVVEGE